MIAGIGGQSLRDWVVRDPDSGEAIRGEPSDALLTVCGCLRGPQPEGGGRVARAVPIEREPEDARSPIVWFHESEPEAQAAIESGQGMALAVQVVPGRYRWILAIEVAETWVTDGLDLTPERVMGILRKALNYAREDEVCVRTVAAPVARDLRVARGEKL